jgi:hypothetical protein
MTNAYSCHIRIGKQVKTKFGRINSCTRDLAKKEAPGGGGITGLISEPGGASCGCTEG